MTSHVQQPASLPADVSSRLEQTHAGTGSYEIRNSTESQQLSKTLPHL